ncbi:unnamed protein product [Urochloa humidicola]
MRMDLETKMGRSPVDPSPCISSSSITTDLMFWTAAYPGVLSHLPHSIGPCTSPASTGRSRSRRRRAARVCRHDGAGGDSDGRIAVPFKLESWGLTFQAPAALRLHHA